MKKFTCNPVLLNQPRMTKWLVRSSQILFNCLGGAIHIGLFRMKDCARLASSMSLLCYSFPLSFPSASDRHENRTTQFASKLGPIVDFTPRSFACSLPGSRPARYPLDSKRGYQSSYFPDIIRPRC